MRAEEISWSTIDDKLYRSLYRRYGYYVNGIKINTGMYVGILTHKCCIVVITDFLREKLSSPICPGAGNQEIFNSRERKSRCGGTDAAMIATPAGDRRKESNFGSPGSPPLKTGLHGSFDKSLALPHSKWCNLRAIRKKKRLGDAQGCTTRMAARCKSRERYSLFALASHINGANIFEQPGAARGLSAVYS